MDRTLQRGGAMTRTASSMARDLTFLSCEEAYPTAEVTAQEWGWSGAVRALVRAAARAPATVPAPAWAVADAMGPLLYRHAFGEISGLIHVAPPSHGNVIRQQLQRQDHHDWQQQIRRA